MERAHSWERFIEFYFEIGLKYKDIKSVLGMSTAKQPKDYPKTEPTSEANRHKISLYINYIVVSILLSFICKNNISKLEEVVVNAPC